MDRENREGIVHYTDFSGLFSIDFNVHVDDLRCDDQQGMRDGVRAWKRSVKTLKGSNRCYDERVLSG